MKDTKKKLRINIESFLPKHPPEKREEIKEKEQLEKRVTVYEEPAVAIAKTLTEHGYTFGLKEKAYIQEPPEHVPLNAFGIYVPHQQTRLQRFFIPKIPLQVGVLYIDDYYSNESKPTFAKKNKNWFLDVFGRQYLKELTDIIAEHAKEYGVELKVFLKTEYPK